MKLFCKFLFENIIAVYLTENLPNARQVHLTKTQQRVFIRGREQHNNSWLNLAMGQM